MSTSEPSWEFGYTSTAMRPSDFSSTYSLKASAASCQESVSDWMWPSDSVTSAAKAVQDIARSARTRVRTRNFFMGEPPYIIFGILRL